MAPITYAAAIDIAVDLGDHVKEFKAGEVLVSVPEGALVSMIRMGYAKAVPPREPPPKPKQKTKSVDLGE